MRNRIAMLKSDPRKNGLVFNESASKFFASTPDVAFSDLSEFLPQDKVPFLDRKELDELNLTQLQRHWREYGYVVLPEFIERHYVDEYNLLRKNLNLGKAHFDTFTPYIDHEIIREITLSPRLHAILCEIMGQDMGLHFILTAYHSTERGWHQDDYLNPETVNSNYCAAWIALGEISADAGPFEFIPGSHKWPCVRRHLVQRYLSPQLSQLSDVSSDGGHWAAYAELFTNAAYVREIERQGLPICQFLGQPGDVLIWHGSLVHRGSPPQRSLSFAARDDKPF